MTTTVPECKLQKPNEVLDEALDEVRRGRLLYRTIHTSLEKLYGDQELHHLAEVYDKHVTADNASVVTFHAMLNDLDLRIDEAELADLIESFFLYQSGGSLEEIAELSAMQVLFVWRFSSSMRMGEDDQIRNPTLNNCVFNAISL